MSERHEFSLWFVERKGGRGWAPHGRACKSLEEAQASVEKGRAHYNCRWRIIQNDHVVTRTRFEVPAALHGDQEG